MEWWGTSGACPQVAGLAALILSLDPTLTPAQVAKLIRDTSKDINLPKACAGAGLIDCEAAVVKVASAKPAGTSKIAKGKSN
jgi:subtilisin family serine protease